jgi:hypothetical protein
MNWFLSTCRIQKKRRWDISINGDRTLEVQNHNQLQYRIIQNNTVEDLEPELQGQFF